MPSSRSMQWLILFVSACVAAAASGLALGSLAKSGTGHVTLLLVLVALSAGGVVLAFRWASANEQVAVSVTAAALGVLLFVWAAHDPVWQADSAVASEELDPLCVRVVALRLCHERQIMGVFDFQDVPEPVVEEARQHVGEMTLEDKRTLCDRTFGDRINACASEAHAGTAPASVSVIRVLLALSASAVPIVIRHRLRPVEA